MSQVSQPGQINQIQLSGELQRKEIQQQIPAHQTQLVAQVLKPAKPTLGHGHLETNLAITRLVQEFPILTSSPTITDPDVLPTFPIRLPISESNTSQVSMQNPISSAMPDSAYTNLITIALKDKEALTLSEIYQWLSNFL